MSSLRRLALVAVLVLLAACGDSGTDVVSAPSPPASTTGAAPTMTLPRSSVTETVAAPLATPTFVPTNTQAPTNTSVPPSSTVVAPTAAPSATGAVAVSPSPVEVAAATETTPTAATTAAATEIATELATATAAGTETATMTAAATELATTTAVATETAASTSTVEARPAVRPDLPGKIAFVRDKDTWLYRPRTGEVRKLIADTVAARWAPDGQSIAFVRGDGLYLADGEGADERRVHEANGLGAPVWAPDGSRIAFGRATAPNGITEGGIWVFEVGSGEVRKVAEGIYPAWAPDSKRLAYVSPPKDDNPPRRSQLRLVNWVGQKDWPVVSDLPPNTPSIGVPGSQAGAAGLEHVMDNPFWDRDGQSIYVASFVIYQALSDFFIWERADATRGGSTFIGELPASGATPAPDRRAVLFSGSSARGDRFFVARSLSGDDPAWQWAESQRGRTAVAPAWAPDSRAVAFYDCALEEPSHCALNLLAPGGATTLIPEVLGGAEPDWSVGLSLDWGRDGS